MLWLPGGHLLSNYETEVDILASYFVDACVMYTGHIARLLLQLEREGHEALVVGRLAAIKELSIMHSSSCNLLDLLIAQSY